MSGGIYLIDMDFTEYKIGYYKRWQKWILNISWFMFIALFVLEVVFGFFFKFNSACQQKIHYCISSIAVPSGINLVSLITATCFIRSPSPTFVQKNYAAIFLFLIIMTVISFFHNYYVIVLVLPCFAIFLAALLSDKKLLRCVFIASLDVEFLSLAQWIFHENRYASSMVIGTSAVVILICCTSYYCSNAIMHSVQEQTDFIYDSYAKQKMLIKELQLEPLTRLYNRIAFSQTIANCIKSYKETDSLLMLALIDLDNFKTVNDKYGHASGDAVLIAFSGLLVRILGGNRNAFRYGGDEFVVLFKNQDLETVESKAEKIRSSFAEMNFGFMDIDFRCSISMGIAAYHPGMTGKQWFETADSAAYAAKTAGKNQFVVVV
jgi:diguanylate cyclase (GGDEF)-like protein